MHDRVLKNVPLFLVKVVNRRIRKKKMLTSVSLHAVCTCVYLNKLLTVPPGQC